MTSNHIPGIDTMAKKPTFQVGPSMNNFRLVALDVNILTLEITEHKLYQIVVGVLNFDPWPQQQAFTQRSMLYIYGKQLWKC